MGASHLRKALESTPVIHRIPDSPHREVGVKMVKKVISKGHLENTDNVVVM